MRDRRRRRLTARSAILVLGLVYLGAAVVPCPATAAGDPLADASARETHVVHGSGEAPCPHHASAPALRPPAKLAAPCACGCGDAKGPAAVFQARLGVALLHAPPSLPAFARAAAPADAPAALPDTPASAVDHVPLAALA